MGLWRKYMIAASMVVLFLAGCTETDDNSADDALPEKSEQALEALDETEHFQDGALEHILVGELNQSGDAVGYHYEDFPGARGEVREKTVTDPDDNGVYEARVQIKDEVKTSNNGISSFFPEDWTAQEVVDKINEAYDDRERLNDDTYAGSTRGGIDIHMYLDDADRIISAFPIYED